MDESLLCSFFADCFALPPRRTVRTGLFEEGGATGCSGSGRRGYGSCESACRRADGTCFRAVSRRSGDKNHPRRQFGRGGFVDGRPSVGRRRAYFM